MDLESGGAREDAPDAKPSLGAATNFTVLPMDSHSHSFTTTDRTHPSFHMQTDKTAAVRTRGSFYSAEFTDEYRYLH
jgi:hypothetical protein